MGFMTVIVASNDEAHDIKKNGERFVNDLHHAMCSGDGADTVGATVHPPQHTDIVQVVLAGGNTSVIAHASHQYGTNLTSSPPLRTGIPAEPKFSVGWRRLSPSPIHGVSLRIPPIRGCSSRRSRQRLPCDRIACTGTPLGSRDSPGRCGRTHGNTVTCTQQAL